MMNKPPSRYQVLEQHGRLIVLVDGQPVNGFAAQAASGKASLQGGAMAKPDDLVAEPVSTSNTHSGNTPPNNRPAESAGVTPRDKGWLHQMGAYGLSALFKARDNQGRILIRRTRNSRPYQAALSREEEAKVASLMGLWLVALFVLVVTLPVKPMLNAGLLFVLFKFGWPMLLNRIPQNRWEMVT
jgi:hypothetical protein